MGINNIQAISPLLQGYLQKNGIQPKTAQPKETAPAAKQPLPFPKSELLQAYLMKNQGPMAARTIQNSAPVAAINTPVGAQSVTWNNDLRSKLRNNEAIIMAVIPRTMNAKDVDGNGLIREMKLLETL